MVELPVNAGIGAGPAHRLFKPSSAPRGAVVPELCAKETFPVNCFLSGSVTKMKTLTKLVRKGVA